MTIWNMKMFDNSLKQVPVCWGIIKRSVAVSQGIFLQISYTQEQLEIYYRLLVKICLICGQGFSDANLFMDL